MSRQGANPDRVIEAGLAGAAQRHAQLRSTDEEALAELLDLTTRTDLLSRAAGHQAAAAQLPLRPHALHQRAAELLVAAGGTDEVIARAETAAVLERAGQPAPSAPRPGIDC